MDATAIQLRNVVRFRDYPFGLRDDPSMRDSMTAAPWLDESNVLAYLRSGYLIGVVMGGHLPDWYDPDSSADPIIDGERRGGVTPMTDGVWFWPAGLIYFIERYHVRVPEEFVEHARLNAWRVDREQVAGREYDAFLYFDDARVPH